MQVADLSIIVLTYDRPLHLQRCLASLAAQTYPAERLEIVVADDGSADATRAVIEEHAREHANVRHVRHGHRGIPATRNLGLRHARAPLVAIVADDHLLPPIYAEVVADFFRRRPDAQVVRFHVVPSRRDLGSRISHVYYQTSILGRVLEPYDPTEVTTRHQLDASGAAAYRREVFERVGCFDESLARAEDSDFAVRLRAAGIAIHYDPRHPIGHAYDPFLRDTLRKSWLTGWYRARHYRKNGLEVVSLGAVSGAARDKAQRLARALAQARCEGTTGMFLAALPFLLLFEAVNKAGFACSWLWGAEASPRASRDS
jgi:GT2 family glycosyltransferase